MHTNCEKNVACSDISRCVGHRSRLHSPARWRQCVASAEAVLWAVIKQSQPTALHPLLELTGPQTFRAKCGANARRCLRAWTVFGSPGARANSSEYVRRLGQFWDYQNSGIPGPKPQLIASLDRIAHYRSETAALGPSADTARTSEVCTPAKENALLATGICKLCIGLPGPKHAWRTTSSCDERSFVGGVDTAVMSLQRMKQTPSLILGELGRSQ